MPNINERPVCHRAEDLVTYLYGEASEVEASDFAGHLQHCDSCRSEFGGFQQVHESILHWRNEALGSAVAPASVSVESSVASPQFVQHERKLTALAALREFFTVSPLWLRGAIGFAALLLCVLGALTIARSWNPPVQLANKPTETKFSQQDVDRQVQQRVAEIARNTYQQTAPAPVAPATNKQTDKGSGTELAVTRIQPKSPRPRGLSRQERVQLAADLRLIPRDEDELPFGLSDEPNQ